MKHIEHSLRYLPRRAKPHPVTRIRVSQLVIRRLSQKGPHFRAEALVLVDLGLVKEDLEGMVPEDLGEMVPGEMVPEGQGVPEDPGGMVLAVDNGVLEVPGGMAPAVQEVPEDLEETAQEGTLAARAKEDQANVQPDHLSNSKTQ